ncbi:MAG: HD domain-containing protein [Nitrososphaera sp.]|uniref:HD domain-containing protein n=1 Tax=Nitrososphaera sp. TaxID=1971748 RepID=UPI0017CCC170|nr:HD domain-containing protein [Nitrososphaera sp.]NWG37763.1 HD domain-containing protein [Nitrososphaera sp.]
MKDFQPFFDAVLGLKTVDRAGWAAKAGVKNPESVADHTYSMCAIGMALSDIMGLDTGKVLRMIILHDLAESVVGDYMPGEITARKKVEQEKKAMKKILSCIPAKARKIHEKAWLEYLQNKTEEARFVHRIDKLEMALQADRYRKERRAKNSLDQFFASAHRGVATDSDLLTEILKSLMPAKSRGK